MAAISIRVSQNNQNFLESMAECGKNRSKTVNAALDLMRKIHLRKELTALATENPDEDALLADEDMEDYLTLISDEAQTI